MSPQTVSCQTLHPTTKILKGLGGEKIQGAGRRIESCLVVRRFAVLRDDDLVEAMAEHGGKKLILQALQQQR